MTADGKAKGTVSWKNPYEGSATAQLSSKFTQTSDQGSAQIWSSWSYSFTTEGPYQLTVECGLSGGAFVPLTDNLVFVEIDNMFVCDAYLGTGMPNNTGSMALTPGNHILTGFHYLQFTAPAQQTGSANQKSSAKWRLDGCESREEVAISNHPYGIVGDFLCHENEPPNLKNQWVDEQSDQFRLTCENSAFHLRYHPNGTNPLPAATCVWDQGINNANIFVPGDTDNDGEYDCFIRSTWTNREPGVDQGVPNVKDQCIFDFDVKTSKLKIEHQVLDVLDHKYRPALPGELAAGDRCVAGLSLALASAGDAGGVLLCDQYVDGVCDALDNLVLVGAIGASVGDPRYDVLLDLNDDGWVLDDDLRALFPGLDLGGASERCVTASSTITIANDTVDPAPGTGFYYLIRGSNPCGAGTYGRTSSGTTRVSSTCPGN